jgi:hypothetical protein
VRRQAELAVARVLGRRPRKLVLLVLLPLFLWIGVMSAIPHKEERFAYVVYPQARTMHCSQLAQHLSRAHNCFSSSAGVRRCSALA